MERLFSEQQTFLGRHRQRRPVFHTPRSGGGGPDGPGRLRRGHSGGGGDFSVSDFIPLATEPYKLAVPTAFISHPQINGFLEFVLDELKASSSGAHPVTASTISAAWKSSLVGEMHLVTPNESSRQQQEENRCTKRTVIPLFIFILSVSTLIAAAPQEQETQKRRRKKKKRPKAQSPIPHFTEEVEVVAKAPEAVPPVSSPSLFVVEKETIEKVSDYNLTKSFSYTTGTYVSTGAKNEAGLQIRGMSSGKIALLYDGIPIYEPYFGSFDLNSIVAEEVESIKIQKGATSVLYGPNVMGGAVNVLTKRPDTDSASVVSSYGSFDDVGVAATGTARRGKFGFLGSFSYNRIDDFEYNNEDGEHVTRTNSDYETKNVTGKLYYYPGESSEIMAEAGYVTSEYGVPSATEIYRPRYWRFSDWDRYLFNVGGTFPLAGRGYLKARGYYVKHHNVLDAYTTEDLNELDWKSTFNNYSYGTFLLGSVLLGHAQRAQVQRQCQERPRQDAGRHRRGMGTILTADAFLRRGRSLQPHRPVGADGRRQPRLPEQGGRQQ